MPTARKYIPHYSLKDYLRWEGDWELIEGIPVAMSPSAGFLHQKTSGAIYVQLSEKLRPCQGCIALYEIDWIVSEDTVVRPDIIVICEEPEGEYITKTPEVIFEVVFRQTAQKDEKVKFEIYEREGVKYYVLVYPELKIAKVYRLQEGRYQKVMDATREKTEFSIRDCAVEFDFSQLW
ncbi:MAG: Uma2 family endonuclease [Nitrospirae bacterium]|nr:MAG: Uma2 family endonuclease [Nitrospirota bacterium]